MSLAYLAMTIDHAAPFIGLIQIFFDYNDHLSYKISRQAVNAESTMQTTQNRQGEREAPPFRSGRFFVVANHWYFSTREGLDKGPFTTRPEAESALNNFLDKCKKYNEFFH